MPLTIASYEATRHPYLNSPLFALFFFSFATCLSSAISKTWVEPEIENEV